jgi:hypothetical protein
MLHGLFRSLTFLALACGSSPGLYDGVSLALHSGPSLLVNRDPSLVLHCGPSPSLVPSWSGSLSWFFLAPPMVPPWPSIVVSPWSLLSHGSSWPFPMVLVLRGCGPASWIWTWGLPPLIFLLFLISLLLPFAVVLSMCTYYLFK